MGRIAVDLRERDHAQQVVLPRRGNAVGRNPLNGIVESARRNLDALADKRIRNSQAAVGLIDAVGELGPVGIALALGIPRDRKLGVRGQIGIGPARGTGNLDARRKRRANGEHCGRRFLGPNGLKRILTGKRHRTHGVNRPRAAVALLLRALDRVLARCNHANVLAHHVVGRRIRRRIGCVGNVLKMAIERALVVRVLPLIVNLIGGRDTGVGVALGCFGRKRFACGDLPRLQSPRDLDAIELDGARLDNEYRTGLLVSEATVGTCHDILTGIGRIRRKGIGGRTVNLRGARRRRIAKVPRPRNVLVGGYIARSRVGSRRNDFARVGLAHFVELNARDVDGSRSADKIRAPGGACAVANLCSNDAANRLALMGSELERIGRRALNVGVIAVLFICNLPLIIQLGGVDIITRALFLGKHLHRVVSGVDIGAARRALFCENCRVDLDGARELKGANAKARRVIAKGNIIRTGIGRHGYVIAGEVLANRQRRASDALNGLPCRGTRRCRRALVLFPGIGDLGVVDVAGAVARAGVRLGGDGRTDLLGRSRQLDSSELDSPSLEHSVGGLRLDIIYARVGNDLQILTG